MEDNKKINVTIPEGASTVEVILREGEAAPQLEMKAPVKTDIRATVGAVVEYLTKRVGTEQFPQERAHLLVDRESVSLCLVINEHDEYLRGTIVGKLEFHPAFKAFGINNAEKIWTPTELGLFFKMNRAFFPDRAANMKLVTDLMNFKATVDNKIERSVKENGDRTDNFVQTVNSNLPASFALNIPIFKGMPAETLEVETFARINGREVAFILMSPGAQETLEVIRDGVIDAELAKVREIAPNIAIIEQ